MKIINQFTDSDNIRIQLFIDDNGQPCIWIFDIIKPNDKLHRIYPSLKAAEKDYNAYLDEVE